VKSLPLYLIIFALTSCHKMEERDLKTFIAESTPIAAIVNDEVPELKEITVLAFAPKTSRNPFLKAQSHTETDSTKVNKKCEKPNLKREKEALETIPLEKIQMRGTLTASNHQWAIVTIPNGTFHIVKTGEHLGLHYGEASQITKNTIKLLELKPDGYGCWKEYITEIKLALK